MVIVIAVLLAVVAVAVLLRLLALSARPGHYGTLITLAAVALVVALAFLAATGRLPWLAAAGAAVAPFLRGALRGLRFVPWLRPVLAFWRKRGASDNGSSRANEGPTRSNGTMSRSEALAILGLGAEAGRDEIVTAHRRLIQRLHPDRGGSSYLAQQLNAAKRCLLENA